MLDVSTAAQPFRGVEQPMKGTSKPVMLSLIIKDQSKVLVPKGLVLVLAGSVVDSTDPHTVQTSAVS